MPFSPVGSRPWVGRHLDMLLGVMTCPTTPEPGEPWLQGAGELGHACWPGRTGRPLTRALVPGREEAQLTHEWGCHFWQLNLNVCEEVREPLRWPQGTIRLTICTQTWASGRSPAQQPRPTT